MLPLVKKGTPRLQHYVPQLLLRRFAGKDGKVWGYDAQTKKMFYAAPKGLAAEGYFYGSDERHATPASLAIENWLSKVIEAPGAGAITALLKREHLSVEKVHAFFRFVAAQMQRTPVSLKRTTDNSAPVFQETAERILKYHKEARANIIAEIKATGATEAEIADVTRIMDEGAIEVTPTREFAVASALDLWSIIAPELSRMKWTFGEIDKSDEDLVIGDHPVTLVDVGGNAPAPLGIKNPNIEIAMPLSPRVVALGHWDGPICYATLVPGTAKDLNDRTLSQAHRFSYASFQSKELLERAVRLHGTGPKIRTHRIRVGDQLILTCNQ
jgi:hypothetical protein